jgi:hypothetical protein
MLKRYGYNEETTPTGRKIGQDTLWCCHGGHTVFLDPNDPSPWCQNCNEQWCGQESCRECVPYMKKIEMAEEIDRRKRLLWQAADNT